MRVHFLSTSASLPKTLLVAAALFAGTMALLPATASAAPAPHGIQGTGAVSGGIQGTGAISDGIQGTGAVSDGIEGTG